MTVMVAASTEGSYDFDRGCSRKNGGAPHRRVPQPRTGEGTALAVEPRRHVSSKGHRYPPAPGNNWVWSRSGEGWTIGDRERRLKRGVEHDPDEVFAMLGGRGHEWVRLNTEKWSPHRTTYRAVCCSPFSLSFLYGYVFGVRRNTVAGNAILYTNKPP